MTEVERELHEELGRLKAQGDAHAADIHGLKTMLEKLFNKFDDFAKSHAPKPMGFPSIMAVLVAGLSSLAIVFGCILWIVNAQTAPVTANINQLAATVQAVNTGVLQTSNAVQLANKEITVVSNRAQANEATLQWILFDENLPKQITVLRGELDHLRQSMERSK